MEVKWIKLDIGIFDNDKIKVILDQKDGYLNFVIWINLLVLAGKCNADGRLLIAPDYPHSVGTISSSTGISEEHVASALDIFCKFNMICVEDDNAYRVVNWDRYQNIIGLEKIREQNRIRQQRHRDKLKESSVKAEVTNDIIKVVETPKKEEPSVVIPDNLNTETFRAEWEKWKGYRRKIKKRLVPETEESQLKKLSKYGEKTAIAMIEQSIGEGWQGLFELKSKKQQDPTPEDYDAEIKRIYG